MPLAALAGLLQRMVDRVSSDPWDVVIAVGSLGFILCLLPQLVRTLRTRRADDLSLAFLVLVLVSSALTFAYSLHAGENAFAVSQATNLVVWGTVLYFKLSPA